MYIRWKKTPLVRGGTRWTEYAETGCDHPHGPESIRLAPVVVESFRPSKQASPRQREVWRPGLSIRQCCISDRETFARTHFWSSLDYAARERFGATTETSEPWASLREQIARVVPAPTERERDIARVSSHMFFTRQPDQSDLEVDHDRYRAAESRYAEWCEVRSEGESIVEWIGRAYPLPQRRGSGLLTLMCRASVAPCWAVLGLTWPCSAVDVALAHMRLDLEARMLDFESRRSRQPDLERLRVLGDARDQAKAFVEELAVVMTAMAS